MKLTWIIKADSVDELMEIMDRVKNFKAARPLTEDAAEAMCCHVEPEKPWPRPSQGYQPRGKARKSHPPEEE